MADYFSYWQQLCKMSDDELFLEFYRARMHLMARHYEFFTPETIIGDGCYVCRDPEGFAVRKGESEKQFMKAIADLWYWMKKNEDENRL